MNRFETVENLKAQLTCIQSDTFTCLKNYVNKFSKSDSLKVVANVEYLEIDYKKSVKSFDGTKDVFGVVVGCDEGKRNRIVEMILKKIEVSKIDDEQTCADIIVIALSYFEIQNALNVESCVKKLRKLIDENVAFSNAMLIKIDNFKYYLN